MDLSDDGLARLWLSSRDFDVRAVETERVNDGWVKVEFRYDVENGVIRKDEIERLHEIVVQSEEAALVGGYRLHLHRDAVIEEAQSLLE